MSILSTHVIHTDEFISSVGKFEIRPDISPGYLLTIDHRRLSVFPERSAASHALADQKTGHPEWDGLQPDIAAQQFVEDSRWTRHSLTIHAVDGGLPSNTPIGTTSGHVPPTVRLRIHPEGGS